MANKGLYSSYDLTRYNTFNLDIYISTHDLCLEL